MVEPIPDLSLAKLLAAILGAFTSLRFMKGSRLELATMGIAGAALSYYGTTPAANWVGVPSDTEGLIGFLIGMFGMAIVAKCYEVIQLTDAKALASELWDAIKRKWAA